MEMYMFNDNPIRFSEELVKKYKYAKLPSQLSRSARSLYHSQLPSEFNMNGDNLAVLTTVEGTPIAKGYLRVVVGDYGAFIEISRDQMIKESLCAKKGEEYRYKDPSYKDSVKYFWFTAKDNSDIKIYSQQKTVSYADYKAGCFYVCPYEVQVRR